ncbi:pectinesterase 3-like protein [Carex littledalei]|uniref:Pectinesterase 3-like protein n=1 Tax=Carex littledalei TaxID=544730 RepID=A0A833QP54_9POAL|nr:pectinesterase 3-like protein [Carex littledalei]
MRSTLLLLAILSISSSLASATCFPRSSAYAVPISALEPDYYALIQKALDPPVQKPTSPTPKPETPPVAKPATPPVTKPETPPVAKPATPPVTTPVTPQAGQPKKTITPPPTPRAGGSIGGAFDAAFTAVIKSFCAKTDEPDLCFSSIKPIVGTIQVPHDATGVLKLAMEVLMRETDAATKTAQKYVKDPKTDKLAVEALNDCLTSYDDAKYNLGQVDSALKANDKGTVNSLLSTVGTDYDTCENGFDDFEITSLMHDTDSKLMKMNSICLAIAKAANLMA